jgi:hypothetical protein
MSWRACACLRTRPGMISRESRSRIANCPSGWGHMGSSQRRSESGPPPREAMRAPISTTSGGATSLPWPTKSQHPQHPQHLDLFREIRLWITKSKAQRAFSNRNRTAAPMLRLLRMMLRLVRIKRDKKLLCDSRCCACRGCCAFRGERGRAKPHPPAARGGTG